MSKLSDIPFISGESVPAGSADWNFLTHQPLHFLTGNFADYIWGGNELYKLKGLPLPDAVGPVAESWEVSGHSKYPSVIDLPGNKRITLVQILQNESLGRAVLGDAVYKRYGKNFPLIAKFFDVQDYMSVQVHPSDDVAVMLGEKDPGKGEVFVILDVYDGAEGSLYLGLKDGVAQEAVEKVINEGGDLLPLLHKIKLQKGQVYVVPPGVIHCWTGGSMAIEITEASDLTYRLYDFDRGRPMHVKKGLASIDHKIQSGLELQKSTLGAWEPTDNPGIESLKTDNALQVERITGDTRQPVTISKNNIFDVLMAIGGNVDLEQKRNEWSSTLKKGHSVLVPSLADDYVIKSDAPFELIRITIRQQ